MSAGQPRPRRGRPRDEAVGHAILAATHALVVAHGYEAVTTADIARRAAVSKQTIYRRWPTKRALVLDALDRWANLAIDGHETESLPAFLAEVCRGATLAAPVLRSLMAEAQHDADMRVMLKERLIEPRREALRRCLDAALGLDVRRREALVRAIYGALWYRLLLDEPLDASFVEDMVALASGTGADDPASTGR